MYSIWGKYICRYIFLNMHCLYAMLVAMLVIKHFETNLFVCPYITTSANHFKCVSNIMVMRCFDFIVIFIFFQNCINSFLVTKCKQE